MKTKTLLRTIALIYIFIISVNVTSAANYDFVSNGIYYKITNNSTKTVKVTFKDYSFNCYSGNVSIPVNVSRNGVTYTVTAIGSSAFEASRGLTEVTIPNSVTSIDGSAFRDCSGLTSVNIPNSVTSLGGSAFNGCSSLMSISISNSVKTIGNGAFMSCSSLTCVTIPESVTTIGEEAFKSCSNLAIINIPSSVNFIGYDAFSGTAWYNSLPDGVVYAGLFVYNYKGVMPENTSITIKEGTKAIVPKAFSYCSNLRYIEIPSSVLTIGQESFRNCVGLTSAVICNSNDIINDEKTSIKESSFVNCNSLKSVIIGNSVDSIGKGAFENCGAISSLSIGNAVKVIASSAFWNCMSIDTLFIPKSVESIHEDSFYGCSSLSTIIVDHDNIVYDSRDNCNAIIKTDNSELVLGCKNTIIPNTVRIIGVGAFERTKLSEITIPKSVVKINRLAFWDCFILSKIVCLGTIPPTIEESSFITSTYNNAVIYVPENAIFNYKNQTYWSKFKHFRECTGLMDYSYIMGPTSILFQANQPVTEINITLNGWMQYQNLVVIGLQPEVSYNSRCELETANGKLIAEDFFTTPALRMTAKAADMITNKDVRLMAETNMADVETSCGFEWRRYDAPEEMPSAKVYCPVYGGVMAGTLKNMSENVYYKYRPFYKSSAGNEYYGDWVAFITADAGVEFEPVVYTYNSPAVTQTEATMQGVALRGSEEITEQGFEYWKTGKTNMLTASGDVTRVTARGERMSKTVSGLQAGTRYTFRAYVTAGGETTFGQEVQFVTLASSLDVNLDGEINIADVNSVISLILENGVVTTGDVNNDGEVNIADINVLIDSILSM